MIIIIIINGLYSAKCFSNPPLTQGKILRRCYSTSTTLRLAAALVNRTQGAQGKLNNQSDDFYVNLGLAVRTLREDLPLIFTKDLNYDIYRDYITFLDPINTFTGIEKYKLILWALRFHGRILFRDISLEVLRIWQPSENMILIRWNLRGVPRVPWEAKGEFQGTRVQMDRNGKIYEHKVDNLAFNFPQPLKPAASVLDLVGACPATPNPTFLWGPCGSFFLFVGGILQGCEGHIGSTRFDDPSRPPVHSERFGLLSAFYPYRA